MTSLYQTLLDAGCDISNHESDLYVKATPTSLDILRDFRNRAEIGGFSYFTSNVDGARWCEVPFMFSPWWDAKGKGAA